jgi:hypothetical protein
MGIINREFNRNFGNAPYTTAVLNLDNTIESPGDLLMLEETLCHKIVEKHTDGPFLAAAELWECACRGDKNSRSAALPLVLIGYELQTPQAVVRSIDKIRKYLLTSELVDIHGFEHHPSLYNGGIDALLMLGVVLADDSQMTPPADFGEANDFVGDFGKYLQKEELLLCENDIGDEMFDVMMALMEQYGPEFVFCAYHFANRTGMFRVDISYIKTLGISTNLILAGFMNGGNFMLEVIEAAYHYLRSDFLSEATQDLPEADIKRALRTIFKIGACLSIQNQQFSF